MGAEMVVGTAAAMAAVANGRGEGESSRRVVDDAAGSGL